MIQLTGFPAVSFLFLILHIIYSFSYIILFYVCGTYVSRAWALSFTFVGCTFPIRETIYLINLKYLSTYLKDLTGVTK